MLGRRDHPSFTLLKEAERRAYHSRKDSTLHGLNLSNRRRELMEIDVAEERLLRWKQERTRHKNSFDRLIEFLGDGNNVTRARYTRGIDHAR